MSEPKPPNYPPPPDKKDEKKEGAIQIFVHDPEERGSFLNKYQVYKMTHSPNLPSVEGHVYRRFSEFEWLRGHLVRTFPGLFVPPLPPKKITGKDTEFLLERKNDLALFMNRLSSVESINRSEPFRWFLASSKSFEDTMKYFDEKLKARTIEELQRLYVDFRFSNQQLEHYELERDLVLLDNFLFSCEQKLIEVVECSSALDTNFVNFTANLFRLKNNMSALHEIEQGYSSRPNPQRLNIGAHCHEWWDGERSSSISMTSHLSRTFKDFIADVLAFREIIQHRASIVASIQKLASKTKKTEIDVRSERYLAAELDLMNKLLHYQAYNTSSVWKDTRKQYKLAMQQFAKQQSSSAKQLNAAWKKLYEEASQEAKTS